MSTTQPAQPTPEPEVVERYDFPKLDRYQARIIRENAEYETAHKAWLVACAPGTKVFRANRYDGCARNVDVRQGVIVRIDEGTISDNGTFYALPGGKHRKVVAKFAKDPDGRFGDDWYGQTCEGHEFHLTREGAVRRLIRYLNDEAADKERDAQKLRVRATALTAQLSEDVTK